MHNVPLPKPCGRVQGICYSFRLHVNTMLNQETHDVPSPRACGRIQGVFSKLRRHVDTIYCRQKEAEFLSEPYTDDNMRETMLIIMEGLESYAPDSEKWHTFLRRLYLLSMGEYRTEKEPEKVG